jgi:hypothetical protein
VLHSHGIEVILDVVYNHTAEGNHFGPMFSFKGADNLAYYKVVEGDERYPATLELSSPSSLNCSPYFVDCVKILFRLHRVRKFAERETPTCASAHYGQSSLLDYRDARGWI